MKLTKPQLDLLTAIDRRPSGADHLWLCHALRGPVREPTVKALERMRLIEHIGDRGEILKCTAAGRRRVMEEQLS